jgi:hypothetical protein
MLGGNNTSRKLTLVGGWLRLSTPKGAPEAAADFRLFDLEKIKKASRSANCDLSAGLDGHQVGKLRPHDYFIGAGGQHEVQTAPLVQFERGGHVQVGNLNLPGP